MRSGSGSDAGGTTGAVLDSGEAPLQSVQLPAAAGKGAVGFAHPRGELGVGFGDTKRALGPLLRFGQVLQRVLGELGKLDEWVEAVDPGLVRAGLPDLGGFVEAVEAFHLAGEEHREAETEIFVAGGADGAFERGDGFIDAAGALHQAGEPGLIDGVLKTGVGGIGKGGGEGGGERTERVNILRVVIDDADGLLGAEAADIIEVNFGDEPAVDV